MTAATITSTKNLMSQLLKGDAFDIFLLEQAVVTTSVTYTIDGRINRSFYAKEEQTKDLLPYEFKPWSEIKELCFGLIRGKNAPLNFKFSLILKPEYTEKLLKKELPDADLASLKALMIIIKNDGTRTVITTGISYAGFTLDKEPEKVWDHTFLRYLAAKTIPFEEMQ